MIRLGARISAARGDPLAYPVTHITGCAPGAVPGLTHAPPLSRCPQRHNYARAVGGSSCARHWFGFVA